MCHAGARALVSVTHMLFTAGRTAILRALHGHRNLGVHTEMLSDEFISLIERGVVTNSEKQLFPGKVVCGFALGTRRLYDFIDDNPMIAMCDMSFVNSVVEIAKVVRTRACSRARSLAFRIVA